MINGKYRFSLALQVVDPETAIPESVTSVISQLRQSVPMADLAMNEDGTSRDEVEWPNFKENMVRFSSRHPDYFFELSYQRMYPENDKPLWLMVFRDGGIEDHYRLDKHEEDI